MWVGAAGARRPGSRLTPKVRVAVQAGLVGIHVPESRSCRTTSNVPSATGAARTSRSCSRRARPLLGTNLASILLTQGVDSVVLCGATTSGCIRATAVDLLQYGWPTLVPLGASRNRAQAPHEANLFDIQAKYADVVSVDEALEFLEGVPDPVGAPV